MNRMLIASLPGLVFACTVHAGSLESTLIAAMRLSEQPNYSWFSIIDDDARSYDIVGQTARDGYTRVKMPAVNSVRRRLGRGVTDAEIEAIFKGNARCVLRTEDGWKAVDELPAPAEHNSRFDRPMSPTNPMPRIGTVIGTSAGSRINRPSSMAARPRGGQRIVREFEGPYSNLQLAISHPHEDLGIIVGSHEEWHVDGDIVVGTLSELGAQLLLVHEGQTEITPLQAAGTFKLWVRDGIVVRYQLRLEGTVAVDTQFGRREVQVHQTSSTVLRNIGTTRVEVPVEAEMKLGS